MSFGSRLTSASNRLIDKFGDGSTWTIKRRVQGAYDPATGSPIDTETTGTCQGVLLDYRDRDRDGTMILATDRKAFVKGDASLDLQPSDIIEAAGIEYTVIAVRDRQLSGNQAGFTLQVRA